MKDKKDVNWDKVSGGINREGGFNKSSSEEIHYDYEDPEVLSVSVGIKKNNSSSTTSSSTSSSTTKVGGNLFKFLKK